MLVVNERGDAPYSEKVVAGWLRSCNVPGVAVAGGFVPGRGRGARGQEADFIVFTPNVCVCIEVKGTLSRTGGQLSCPVNGRWSMPGFAGDPVHVRAGDVNPLNQARSAMFSLKSITASVTGAERFVSALVVVVPLSGTVVTLNKAPKRFMPKGVDVLLGDRPHELFAWLQRGRFRASVWTIARVGAMLDALGVNDPATDRAALAAQGFPATVTTSTDPTSDDEDPFAPDEDPFAPTTSWNPDPDTEVEPSAATGTQSSYEDHYNAWRPSYTPTGYRPPVAPAPPGQRPPFPPRTARTQPHGGRSPVRSGLLAVAALALVVFGFWYMAGGHHPHSHDSTGRPEVTSVTEAPAMPAPAVAPAQAEVPPTTAHTARPCYPLQPDC
ncbi:nuclease-related domain-containing protein [Nocardia amamiensis]|uniref:nuclease-related domain-containing protein n=1 Tax=Nocardia amamiensis TaxID=404578 RepID=UPI0008362DB9|nr:nuclease-related domain-containing protein [Nocardia amamiensis]